MATDDLRHAVVHAVRVKPRSTESWEHGDVVCPDLLIMSPRERMSTPTGMEAYADDRYIYLKNPSDEAAEMSVLYEWHAVRPDDWDRSVGAPSNDTCWTTSRLWRMIDPRSDVLCLLALERRVQFAKEHLPSCSDATDVGLAMLAMYDAANGQRASRNWESVARIVAQMDDLLRRDYLPAVPDRSKDER